MIKKKTIVMIMQGFIYIPKSPPPILLILKNKIFKLQISLVNERETITLNTGETKHLHNIRVASPGNSRKENFFSISIFLWNIFP